jgi:tetratricopeptide (TPR) repeat protein
MGMDVHGAAQAPLPDTPNPIEIAMREVNAGAPADSPAAAVLRKHARLIDAQIASERMGFTLKVLTAVAGLVFALALGSMVRSASQERGLVIEPFSVPPEFAERGLTGQVLASRVLDALSEMGEKTGSLRAASTYANNWNGDIKVQIPQTGVSVGELRRYLVEWLGKQTRIGGELYRANGGLVLAARTGTAAAAMQAGASEADLERMIQAAAEAVYATTQPYRYAIYLQRSGNRADMQRARELLEVLSRTGDTADRMWAHTALNLHFQADGDTARALRAADAALAIDPRFNLAHSNRAGALHLAGRFEEALRDNRAAAAMLRTDGARFMDAAGIALSTPRWAIPIDLLTGDYRAAREHAERLMALKPGEEFQTLFDSSLGLHEIAATRGMLARLPPLPVDADAHVRAAWAVGTTSLATAIAFAREDWGRVVELADGLDTTHLIPGDRMALDVVVTPIAAIARARTGDTAGARRMLEATSRQCYPCLVARGTVEAVAGDVAASERWFDEAERQGPSLAFAAHDRGQARLARGDVAGAVHQFELAARRGPRWADPLKGWGDALAHQGDARGALAKYAAAAERAPRWGGLHLAWGLALRQSGDMAGAEAKLTAALRMDLTAEERAQTRRVLGRRT